MAHFVISDIHLRLDEPERCSRFVKFVDGLAGSDTLIVVGDLYDFWFVSRQRDRWSECVGRKALVSFRHRGGHLRVLSGNHDSALQSFVAEEIGVPFELEPVNLDLDGTRFHLTHGHLVGHRVRWKSFMESRTFLQLFSRVPDFVAKYCDEALRSLNNKRFAEQNLAQLMILRDFVQCHQELADVFVFGHIHDRIHEAIGDAELFVLGDWIEGQSYLVVDDGQYSFVMD